MITIQKPNFLYSEFTVDTRNDLDYRLSRYGSQIWGSGYSNVRSGIKDDYIYVFHAEKRRKKVERTVKRGKKVSTIISRGHWVVRVFRFKKTNVVKAEQFKNHFNVVLKVQ